MAGCGPAGKKVDAAMVDRIMLRFRPIAPRPEEAGRGGSRSGDCKLIGAGKRGMAVASNYRAGRRKRRYARVRKKNNLTRKTRTSNTRNLTFIRDNGYLQGNQPKIKLADPQLLVLPEIRKGDGDRTARTGSWATATMVDQDVAEMVVNTWLTVERVITTERSPCAGGASYNTRADSLENDTCPVFVTDDRLRSVEWVNGAYKRMVVEVGLAACGNRRNESPEVRVVGLGVKEGLGLERLLPLLGCWSTASFTCWVRLECVYTWRKEGKWSRTVPCDVWRMMELGGWLAWRMDVKAALGLAL